MERILSRGWAGREAGLEASRQPSRQAKPQYTGEAGVEASLESLKARSLSLSARLKSLEAGLGDKPRAWLAGRTKAYK